MLLEEVQERRGVGAEELFDLLAVLKEYEGRHCANTKILSEVREMVDVEFGKINLVLELGGLGPPIEKKGALCQYRLD